MYGWNPIITSISATIILYRILSHRWFNVLVIFLLKVDPNVDLLVQLRFNPIRLRIIKWLQESSFFSKLALIKTNFRQLIFSNRWHHEHVNSQIHCLALLNNMHIKSKHILVLVNDWTALLLRKILLIIEGKLYIRLCTVCQSETKIWIGK